MLPKWRLWRYITVRLLNRFVLAVATVIVLILFVRAMMEALYP